MVYSGLQEEACDKSVLRMYMVKYDKLYCERLYT